MCQSSSAHVEDLVKMSARSNFRISANAMIHDQVSQVLVGRAHDVDVFYFDFPIVAKYCYLDHTLFKVFCTFVALSGEPSGDSAR